MANLLRLFWILMIVYAVVNWVPSLQGRWSYYVARVVEPVLEPVRRVVPPIGGLDTSYLIVIILVGWLMRSLPSLVCAPYYH